MGLDSARAGIRPGGRPGSSRNRACGAVRLAARLGLPYCQACRRVRSASFRNTARRALVAKMPSAEIARHNPVGALPPGARSPAPLLFCRRTSNTPVARR